MIIKDDKKKTVTIFYSNPRREIVMSEEEYAELEDLIKNPPRHREIIDPPKPWSECAGEGCAHPSHKQT